MNRFFGFFIAAAFIFSAAFISGCVKDGENGKDGTNGAQGQQGQQGADGKNSYLVIFDSDGGTPMFSLNGVKHGDKVTAPPDPKKVDGVFELTFGGWFASGAEAAFDFDTPITDNITLTAKWFNPYFAKWVADWVNYTFSANELRFDESDAYFIVSPLTWTAVVNTNNATKDDYPSGYKITGLISEEEDSEGYVGQPFGDDRSFFIHKDGKSMVEQADNNAWFAVYTKDAD